jgi:hypothetical protein
MRRALLACLVSVVVLVHPLRAVAFEEVDNPESVDPVARVVVEEDFQNVARPRVVMRIEVEHGDDTQVGVAMAQALRDGLRNQGEARVASVFAYFPGDDTDGLYTAGIGMASKDGKGWTGDGDLLGSMPSGTSDEEGKIFVVVGSALDGPDDATQLIFPFAQDSGNGNADNDVDRARDEDDRSSEDDDAITAQERRYIDGLNDGMIELGDASTAMGELFTDAGENPTLIRDDEWMVQTAAQFVRIQQVAEDAQALNPSDRQEHIQELWLAINALTTAAVDDYTVGIDSLDPPSLEQGAARYVYAALLVSDLIAARDAFNEDPNDPIEPEHVIGPVQACDEFDSYADAQEYYPAHPEEQPTIDPDFDGLACEVFFGRE